MIIILYYYICRRSVYVRVCVSTYVHVNVGLCADECVYTSVREWGAHVRGCVCMCVRVRLRQWGCVCEGMCVRVWALIHVRLRVRARVRAGVRARKYACVIIVLYHYVRAQFVSAHVRMCVHRFVYVRACERTCVSVFGRMCVRECVRIRVCMCVCIRERLHVRVRVGAHACASSRTRGCACVHMHA